MIWVIVLLALGVCGVWVLLHRGTRWGSTREERALELPGDEYLHGKRHGKRRARVVMTRAISISAPPGKVWPWISQLGRGAGWYSVDWLDNARKVSARHLVSWIPELRLGDATAIGYLRYVDPGQSLAWWLDGGNFLGSSARSVTCFHVAAEGQGTRVISRISADATGPTAHIALLVFRVIDSIMASRQLIGIRNRVESSEAIQAGMRERETGDRDQYQLYEVVYASGEGAGVVGKEEGGKWRHAAIRDGILDGGD